MSLYTQHDQSRGERQFVCLETEWLTLQDGAGAQSAGCNAREEGGEQEVVPRADNILGNVGRLASSLLCEKCSCKRTTL